jgi:hypothetical protein
MSGYNIYPGLVLFIFDDNEKENRRILTNKEIYASVKKPPDLREGGCGCVDWIGLAQDRDRGRARVSAVMTRRVP